MMPTTMRAAHRATYGPPRCVTVRDVARPSPADDEVLVRVRATTINRTDCAVLTGRPAVMRLFVGLARPRSPVPGTDFAGDVVEVGAHVERAAVGDRVFGFFDEGLATQAEYVVIPPSRAMRRIPDGIDYETAVASVEGAHYARNFINKVDLRAGDSVLVNGGTGAIGSAAIQMLTHAGARVVATCRGEHAELVTALGATRIIDYEREDFTRDAETFRFVFDSVGKSTFGRCRRLLEPGGVYISSELGPGGQNPLLALTTPLLRGRRVAFPLPTNIPASLDDVAARLEGGHFAPLIDRRFRLDDVAEAYAYVASGQKVGNVILQIAS